MTFDHSLPAAITFGLAYWLASATLLGAAQPAAREPEVLRVVVGTHAGLTAQLLHLAPLTTPRSASTRYAPVLLVHGATFPSRLAFAYRLRGTSWMDDLAAHGFDAWALDFLGYGGSDRYPEMAAQADAHPPLGRTADAASQIEAAVRFIRLRTGAARVSIVAHSWGTLPAGRFAATHGDLVERLVLFGPLVDRHDNAQEEAAAPGAFAEISRDAQRASFDFGVPPGTPAPFGDADFKAWADLYFAAGHGDVVRVPSGPVVDAADADRGLLPYAPEAIRAPTLLVRGSWDAVSTADDIESLLDRLGAPHRLAVTLAGGTHRMHLEPTRRQLFRTVDAFLAAGKESAGEAL